MATTRDILLKIVGDPGDAERALKSTAAKVQEFGRLQAAATVDVNTAQAFADVQRIEQSLDRLDRKRVDVKVDVDKAALSSLTTAFGAGGAGGGGANAGLQSFSGGLSRLGPLIQGAAIAVGALLLPALVALAASFAAAAAGAAALGVALIGALGPAVLVAVAAFARFAQVIKAVKEEEEKRATQARAVANAIDQQKAAQERLAQAQTTLRAATTDAYNAWADAIERVKDNLLAVEGAQLGVERARLNRRQAEEDLKNLGKEAGLTGKKFDDLFKKFTDVSFDPSRLKAAIKQNLGAGTEAGLSGPQQLDFEDAILRVKEAKLAEKLAADALTDSHTNLNRSREEEAKFTQQGIAAYAPYAAALKGVEDAERAVARATRQLATAREAQGKEAAKLTSTERSLVSVLKEVKKSLTEAFSPATNAIFKGVISFLKDFAAFAKDSAVRGGLTAIGRAVGTMIAGFGRMLRTQEARSAFVALARGAADLVKILGSRVFLTFFQLMTRIAVVALPHLVKLMREFTGWFEEVNKSATKSRLNGIISGLVQSFRVWVGLARAVFNVIIALFAPSKEAGDSLVKEITDGLNDLAKWLREHRAEVKSWFDVIISVIRELIKLFKALLPAAQPVLLYIKGEAWVVAQALKGIRLVIDGIVWVFEKLIGVAGRAFDAIKKAKDLAGQVGNVGGNIIDGALGIVRGHSSGGPVPGRGSGDIIPAMLEPGEFVIRKSIARAIGLPRLNAINSGGLAAVGGGSGVVIENQNVILPAAPGHGQMGDPRHQAVQFAREMKRRGGGAV